MKKTIKKLTAGVSALVMTAALSATTVPAFASEYEALQKADFAASFTNSDTRKVAQYLFDNGMSLEEAKDTMETYEKGLEIIAEREIRPLNAIDTGRAFYSENSVAISPHYCVIIADNASASVETTLNLSFSRDWIDYDFTEMPYTVFNANDDFTFRQATSSRLRLNGDVIATSTNSSPRGVLRFPFEIVADTDMNYEPYTESTIYHKFTLVRSYCESLNGKDTTFSFETYALGDIDHSGSVDEADSTYMLQFLVQIINDLSFSYTDKSDNIANIVNFLALDANQDGVIDMSDSIKINKWAAGDLT